MAALQRLPQLNSISSSACNYAPSCGNSDAVVPEQFPVGLRVMVVDDDVICLRILEQMLKRCNYVVTTFSQATAALNLLRERKGCFDLVLSDVHMPDMDGFKLLELVGLEMDLPVIMMSADGRNSTVMRGIRHGACDYLIKPIRKEELKTIWQHVLRKKCNETREHGNSGSLDERDRRKRGSDDVEYVSSVNEGSECILTTQKKRKDGKEEDDELENDDPAASKKPRVVWSVELHQQFVSAVDQLGIDKAVPKRILELMNVPGLTRENVASHLQKFRLYLKRLSVVAQQQGGNPNSFYAPLEQNSKLGPLGRYDFQALAASGQIPPQTLAALQAELLGRPIGSLVLPVMEQPTLLQASLLRQKSSPVEQGVAYGQPLMKCSSNISKPLTPNITSPENDHLGFGAWVPNSLGTVGTSSNITGMVAQNGNMSVSGFQNQQQQKQSILQEPTRSINVQPSCLVVPTQSPSSHDRNGSHPANQSCSFNMSSVINYNLHSSQSNNLSLSVGQMLDRDLKTISVLSGYPGPSPCFPSMSSCSANATTGAQGRVQDSGPTFGGTRHLAGYNDVTDNVNFNQVLDCGPLRNLGFVGKGTSIPSRFAVYETESPLSHYNHGNTYWDNNGSKVKLEPNVDFSENSTLGSPILQHFSPNDTMSVFSD